MKEDLSIGHQIWRCLPAGGRRAALSALARRAAPRLGLIPPERSKGLVVAGELSQNTGMGEAARSFLAAAELAGVARGAVTLGVGRKIQGDAPPGAALLLVVNAPSIALMLARADKAFLRKRRVIGAWAWELPVVPKAWVDGARYVHEAWVASPFTVQALEPLLPGRVRVVPYPLAMFPLKPTPADRAGFGLPEDAVVTLMVFALGSSFTRKNPLAGIAAFKRAFGERQDQILVIKFTGTAAYPREAERILAFAGPNIKLFSGNWDKSRLESLIESADILLSLHRAEGFGLLPAEAMLRGKAVVATGWSGNMAYMDEASAALAGYSLVPVVDETDVYGRIPGSVWAEPDIAHAAELLRKLGDNAAFRVALGERGRLYVMSALDGKAFREALRANGID